MFWPDIVKKKQGIMAHYLYKMENLIATHGQMEGPAGRIQRFRFYIMDESVRSLTPRLAFNQKTKNRLVPRSGAAGKAREYNQFSSLQIEDSPASPDQAMRFVHY
jgi:hypothetical protein